MLHGQDGEHFQIHGLRNKGIDYLALGHIHSYQKEKLDARGIFCYPGCLEGRGFDECGEHGFTLMEISEETGAFTHAFIPFASRNLYTIPVSVQECTSSYEIGEKIKEALRSTLCERKDLIKILLTGALDVNCEKNLIYLHSKFAQDYYFFKISDETTWKVDPEEYLLDESLKGEFVRTVLGEQELSLEEKNEIIRYGLQAIAGEEIGADAITTMSH